MSERTDYDQMMQAQFNPMREGYNTPPFPGYRTQADVDLQKKWCPKCPGPSISENYAPLTGFRTEFDKQLQKKWCGNCN